MKKLLPAIFTLALIVLGAIYYFNQSIPETAENESWQCYVPENVASVLQINTIKLRDLLISEGFKSPRKLKSLYDDLDSMKTKIKIPTKEVEELIRAGLLLPNQFTAFEIIDVEQSILCSVFPLKKKNTFNKLFKERAYTALSKNLFYLEEKKFGVLLDGNNCLILYGAAMSDHILKRTSETLLQRKMSFNNEQIETDKPEFSLNINKGSMLHHQRSPLRNFNIEVLGTHQSGVSIIDVKILKNEKLAPFLIPVKNKFPEEKQKNSIASIAFNLNLKDYPLQKTLSDKQVRDLNKSLKVIHGSVIDIDSIWNGEISFILKKPFVTEKSFTSYTYNDNFEKVEQVSTKADTLPDFELFFTLTENGNQKLSEKSWVQNSEFVAYPLQKVFFNSNKGLAYLSPVAFNPIKTFNIQKNQDATSVKSLNVMIDITELISNYPYIFEENERIIYNKHINKICIKEVDIMSYQLELSYTNKSQHGLISLLELLNDQEKMTRNSNKQSSDENLP